MNNDFLVTSEVYDDVFKWKHFPRYWSFVQWIRRSPVNSPHKGQWRGALMFSLICAWINGSVNNDEAGDLRRHCAHCDVSVMDCQWFWRMTSSEHLWQIASLATKNSYARQLMHYYVSYTLCFIPEHTIPLKTIINHSFRHSCQRRSFLTYHCDVTTVYPWRLTNAKYWNCDVIFVDCSCTRKLAQIRY